MTHPLNLPAPGRCQSVYVVFTTSHRPVFLVNSRQGHFSAAPNSVPREEIHHQGHPLSRSYGVNLPSSLRMVFSFTLGLLPLSTCVGFRYGHNIPINEAFLGDVVRVKFPKAEALRSETFSVNNVTVLLTTITSLQGPTHHVHRHA